MDEEGKAEPRDASGARAWPARAGAALLALLDGLAARVAALDVAQRHGIDRTWARRGIVGVVVLVLLLVLVPRPDRMAHDAGRLAEILCRMDKASVSGLANLDQTLAFGSELAALKADWDYNLDELERLSSMARKIKRETCR